MLAQGEWELAKTAFEDAGQLAESLDDLPGVVDALNSLGAIAVQEQRPDSAVPLHRRALGLAEYSRQPSLILPSLTKLASALHAAGHTAEAQERYQIALSLAQQSGDRKHEAVVLNNLGLLELTSGAYEAAKTKFESAAAINQSLNEPRERSANLLNLGLVAEAQGDLDAAQRRFESALEMDKAGEQQPAIAGDLVALARVLDKRGDKPAAFSYYQRAYGAYKALDYPSRAKELLQRLAALAGELGRRKELGWLEEELKSVKGAAVSR